MIILVPFIVSSCVIMITFVPFIVPSCVIMITLLYPVYAVPSLTLLRVLYCFYPSSISENNILLLIFM